MANPSRLCKGVFRHEEQGNAPPEERGKVARFGVFFSSAVRRTPADARYFRTYRTLWHRQIVWVRLDGPLWHTYYFLFPSHHATYLLDPLKHSHTPQSDYISILFILRLILTRSFSVRGSSNVHSVVYVPCHASRK